MHVKINEPFLITPFSLLKTPEYLRFFDGASIGSVYRLLRTRVWRQGASSLRFKSDGWVSRVAKLYDDGWLAAYFSTEELMDATGFSWRRIEDLLDKLEELKLIRQDTFGEGILCILGRKLTYTNPSTGMSVGDSHEGFFIDAWETKLRDDEVGFRTFLLESLAPPGQKNKFLGKIFPTGTKNFSENGGPEIDNSARYERDDVATPESPRIDKVRIVKEYTHSPDSHVDAPAPKAAATKPAATKPTQDAARPDAASSGSEAAQTLINEIRQAPDEEAAVTAAREAYVAGVTLSQINRALVARNPKMRYTRFPRFSMALSSFDPNAKNPHVGLAKLWSAFYEDMTGVVSTSTKSFYTGVVAAYKNTLLKEFPAEQVLWALENVVAEGGTDADFLATGGRNLITLTRQRAARYQTMLEERRIARLQDEAAKVEDARAATKVKDLSGMWDNIDNDPWLQRVKFRLDLRKEEKQRRLDRILNPGKYAYDLGSVEDTTPADAGETETQTC